MKLAAATFATAILLAVAGAAPATHAQDQQQQDKTHPKQQQKPAHPQQQRQQQPPRPQRPQQHQQQRQQEQRPQAQHQQQQAQHQQQKVQQQEQKRTQEQQRTQQKQQQKVQKAQQKQQQREQNASHPQPTRTQRAQHAAPERGGQPERGNPQQTAHYEHAHFRRYTPQRGERVVRIPDPQFRDHFGRDHRFRVGTVEMVGGFPRFQYSGFWFVLEEPWPGYWAYDSDDFYVMFTDGNYWLCNYDDPGVQIELTVVAG